MDKTRFIEVLPPDVTHQAIREITSDLRSALEVACCCGDVDNNTFLRAWHIVSEWDLIVSSRYDREWARQHDPNYRPTRETKYEPGMDIPVK